MAKISIKSKKEVMLLKQGGRILAETLFAVVELAGEAVKKEISAGQLNRLAEEIISRKGAEPSFLGYAAASDDDSFPAALCVSVNNEVVHGVPAEDKFIREGDIVSFDLGVKYKGLYTDAAVTIGIGKISEKAKKLIEATRKSLEIGMEQIYPGSYLGNYGNAVERYIKSKGFSVVKKLVGHGVGYAVHEAPQIPNYGKPGSGDKIKQGMVFALEPMANIGSGDVVLSSDGFAVKTADGTLSAHFEHTVAVTPNGHEILTELK